MQKPDYSLLFTREHPFFRTHKNIWLRNHHAYSGGKDYVREALVPHLSEIKEEYDERLKRAYYFNWPRKIARIITQYVLAARPERQNADGDLVEDWSRTGLRTDEVMRQFSTYLNIFGAAWLAVDMPSFDGVKTKADEISEKLRPYCVALSPLQVTDWCYGLDGELDWVLVKEFCWDNSDPYNTPVEIDIRKLWTRNDVTVVAKYSDGRTTENAIQHNLGVIPFIRKVEVDGFGLEANHWFDDVVTISDAILNNESESQMNTIKQMFGLLVVSESFANNARAAAEEEDNVSSSSGFGTSETQTKVSGIISRSAAIIESAEDKGISRYISPSGVENSTIRTENQALVRLMFECVGLAVSKDTKMVESAEAKLWDFQNIEQYMKTRADVLEQCEYQAWQLMNKWMPSIPLPTISYNRNFAVLDLQQSVQTLLDLSGFNQDSDEYQKEVNKTAVVLLNRLRQMSQEKQDTITKEIEVSTPATDAIKRQEEMFSKKDGDGDQDDEETDRGNSDVDDKGKDQK